VRTVLNPLISKSTNQLVGGFLISFQYQFAHLLTREQFISRQKYI